MKVELILEKIEELKKVGDSTHAQAVKTNGRVNKLENWRWFITGAVGVISFLLANNYIHFIK